jgi:hypothetical protein
MQEAGRMGEAGEAHISLTDGVLKIRTQKDGGWYEERRKIKYSGEALSFMINPEFLKDILGKAQKVTLGNMKMKMEQDNTHFVVCLEKA